MDDETAIKVAHRFKYASEVDRGTSFAGDADAVYIASQVVRTGKCHRAFTEKHKAKLIEAHLARYNMGIVSMETWAWGFVFEGSTFFQDK